jgi:hypothetical protein
LVDLGMTTRNNLVKACIFLALAIVAFGFSIALHRDATKDQASENVQRDQQNKDSYWELTDPIAIFLIGNFSLFRHLSASTRRMKVRLRLGLFFRRT